MTSKILITGAIFCAITTTGAHAVTKCVALNTDSGTTCTSNYKQYKNYSDWTAFCTTNDVRTTISGVAICSDLMGTTYQALTGVSVSETFDDNRYCWCRVISPALSQWVYTQDNLSGDYCARDCAYTCALAFQGMKELRRALFGSLSD